MFKFNDLINLQRFLKYKVGEATVWIILKIEYPLYPYLNPKALKVSTPNPNKTLRGIQILPIFLMLKIGLSKLSNKPIYDIT